MALQDLLIQFENLDSYPRLKQMRILDRLAFQLYLKKGRVPPAIQALRAIIHLAPPGIKFNPYHDPDNGQFTFAPGGPADDKPDDKPAPTGRPQNDTSEPAASGGSEEKPAADTSPQYSPDKPGWHNYVAGPNLICTAAQDCTPQEIADQLARFSVPGQDPTVPAVDGSVYPVYIPGTEVSVGQIKTIIGDDGLTVTNVTQPGHLFSDGVVIRGAYQGSDGNWYMLTDGYGNNTIPGLSGLNQMVGPKVFNSLDDAMRTNIARHH